MAALAWATIASIIYFSLYVSLLLSLAFYVHKIENHDSKTSFLKAVWNKRGIYGQILVHLYDTATDIGVLIQWGIYAKKEAQGENIESINMNGLFWTSIGFIILYRIISAIIACYSAKVDTQTDEGYCLDGFLGLIDMYVIKAVYGAMKEDAEEPTIKQRMIQLTEAIFESLPQVVLQSVFIIRSQNDPYLSQQNILYLVGLSLLASLASIASKYIYADKECVIKEAKESKWSKTSPYVNKWYLLRVIWRFSFVTIRFTIFSLLWSVLGGAFLLIFLSLSFLFWCTLIYMQMNIGYCLIVGYGFISLVATPAHQSYTFAIAHGIEMIIVLCVITLFAFNKSIDCGICADPIQRQATPYSYILSFIIAGWIAMIVDFVTYYLMLYFERFDTSQHGLFNVFKGGIQHKVTPHQDKIRSKEEILLISLRSANPNIFVMTLMVLIPLTLCILYAVDFHPTTCYFLVGVAVIISNIYMIYPLKTLLKRTKEFDHDVYSIINNTKPLAEENIRLIQEVNRLSLAKHELQDTCKRIKDAMARQEVNLGKFRQLIVNLEASDTQNLDVFGNLQSMAAKMESKWKDQLFANERKRLHVCFDRFEWEENSDGITREQFTQFKLTLPLEYQLRLTKTGDWNSVAGDDGILQLDEFVELLDNFAQDVVQQKHEKKMLQQLDSNQFKKFKSETDDNDMLV